MRKPDFILCENKDADQLCSNCIADKHPVFTTGIVQFLFYLYPKFQAFFCDNTGRFVSDLVGNLEDRFSGVAAHLIKW